MQYPDQRFKTSPQTVVSKPIHRFKSYRTQQNQQEQRQEQNHNFDIELDDNKCKIFIALGPINNNYIQNQQFNQQPDGTNVDQQIIKQKVIQIIAIYDQSNFYIGILNEKQIEDQLQKLLTIDDIYKDFVSVFNNPEENQQNGPIKMHLTYKNIELVYQCKVIVNNRQKKEYFLSWNLLREEDKKIVDQKIQTYHYPFTLNMIENQQNRFMSTVSTQLGQILPVIPVINSMLQDSNNSQENIQSFISSYLFNISQQASQLNQQNHSFHFNSYPQSEIIQQQQPQSDISQKQYPELQVTNLKKTTGKFWVFDQIITELISFKFKIKQIPQNGVIIGLDDNINPNKYPAYGYDLNIDCLNIQSHSLPLQSALQVGDQVIFKIDIHLRKMYVRINEKEIIKSKLQDQGQIQLYLVVGFHDEVDDINDFIQ